MNRSRNPARVRSRPERLARALPCVPYRQPRLSESTAELAGSLTELARSLSANNLPRVGYVAHAAAGIVRRLAWELAAHNR